MNISEERLKELLDIERKYKARLERDQALTQSQSLNSSLGELKANNVVAKTPRSKSVPKVKTPKRKGIPKLQKRINQKNRRLGKIDSKTRVEFNGRQRWVINTGDGNFKLVRPDVKGEEDVIFKINYVDNKGSIERKESHSNEKIEGVDFILAGDNRDIVASKVEGDIFKSENGQYYRKAQSKTGKRIYAFPIEDPTFRDLNVNDFVSSVDGIKGGIKYVNRNLRLPLTAVNSQEDIKKVENNVKALIHLIPNIISRRLLPEHSDFKTNVANVSFKFDIVTSIENNEDDPEVLISGIQQGIHVDIPFDENKFRNQLDKIITKFSTSDKDIILTQVYIFFVQTPSGGCLESKSHHDFVNMSLSNGEIILSNPNTGVGKNNNCFFYCFKPEFKAKGIKLGKIECNKIRKRYNLIPNCKIPYDIGIKIIFDILELKVSVCNEKEDFFGDTSEADICLMLISEHYLRFKSQRKICSICGKAWVSKHNEMACRQRRMYQHVQSSKEKLVLPKRITPKGWEDSNEMDYTIHYDIESYKIEHGISVPNAVGWVYKGNYRHFYGEGCIDRFVETLLTEEEYKEACFLNAFNGSSFDHILVINSAEKKLGLGKIKPLRGAQGIISASIGHLQVIDIRLHMIGSLNQCLKDFGCVVSKGSFDHNKNGANLDDETKAELLAYLEIDVRGLEELSVKLHNEYKTNFGSSWVHTISTSQMAYAVWKNDYLKSDLNVCIPKADEYSFIKGSIFGGRTQVSRKYFESKHWNEIKERKVDCNGVIDMTANEFNRVDDYVLDLDVNSLYPSAMLERFPVGSMKHTLTYVEGKMGIYHIKYVPNKKLMIPVLPKHEMDGLKWTLEDGEGTYSSVDIETARKYGYRIEVMNGMYWEESEKIFEEYILNTYDRKKKAVKGTPAYQVAKLFMNGLYGKTLQKPRNERTFYVTKHTDWNDIIPKYYLKYIDTESFKNTWIVTGEAKDTKLLNENISKPSQLGVFVLSYSRRLMMEYFDKLGCLWNKNQNIFYTDTDSIQIHGSQLNFALGNEIGMLSDDLSSGGKKSKIVRAIWVSPKMYMLEYLQLQADGKTVLLKGHKVGKGTKKRDGIIPITAEQYLDMVNGESLNIENKDVFRKTLHKVNSKQIAKGIDPFSIVIENQKKVLNKKIWNGRVFDEEGNSVPKGYDFPCC